MAYGSVFTFQTLSLDQASRGNRALKDCRSESSESESHSFTFDDVPDQQGRIEDIEGYNTDFWSEVRIMTMSPTSLFRRASVL